MTENRKKHLIEISGAGPAGLAAALAIANTLTRHRAHEMAANEPRRIAAKED